MKNDNSSLLMLLIVVALFVGGLLYLHSHPAVVKIEPTLPKLPIHPLRPDNQEKIQLYLFTQPGCAPCVQLKKALQDPKVKEALKRFDLHELQANSEEARKYEVQMTPTLVAVGKTGPSIKVGYLPPAKLVEWLDSVQ